MAVFPWTEKKILVTGGSGFLGGHVVTNLISRGVSPTNISIPRRATDDLRSADNCRRLVEGVDIVMHLAAVVGGSIFQREHAAEIFYDTILMGAQLMEAARQAHVAKMVLVGTINSYPAHLEPPLAENDLWNGYPEETSVSYGLAKRALLVQAQAYRRQYGIAISYLILPNLYGSPAEGGGALHASHAIPSFSARIVTAVCNRQAQLEIPGAAETQREFLHVTDAAEAVVLAAERYNHGEPLNIGPGQIITLGELVQQLATLLKYQGRIIWRPDPVLPRSRRFLDSSRVQALLGFRPRMSFTEGLRNMIYETVS